MDEKAFKKLEERIKDMEESHVDTVKLVKETIAQQEKIKTYITTNIKKESEETEKKLIVLSNQIAEQRKILDGQLNELRDSQKAQLTNMRNYTDEARKAVKSDFDTASNMFAMQLGKLKQEIEKEVKTVQDAADIKIKDLNTNLTALNTNLTTVNTQLTAKTAELDTTDTDITQQLQKSREELTATITHLEQKLQNDLVVQNKNLQLADQNLAAQHGKTTGELRENLGQIGQLLNQSIESNQEEFDLMRKQSKEALIQLSNELQLLLKGLDTRVNQKMDEHITAAQTHFQQHDDALTELKTSTTRLHGIGTKHAEALVKTGELINEIQSANIQSFEQMKADQKTLMQSFQRILTDLSETIENRIIIVTKEVREMLERTSKDIAVNYMSKKDQTVLEESMKTIDVELRKKSEEIRVQLFSSFEKAIKDFDKQGQAAIEKVESYKRELEQYKDDLQALIERKVNAKYDFVFGLLGDMVTKTENLSHLITQSKVKEVQYVEKPVSTTEQELSSEKTVKTPQ